MVDWDYNRLKTIDQEDVWISSVVQIGHSRAVASTAYLCLGSKYPDLILLPINSYHLQQFLQMCIICLRLKAKLVLLLRAIMAYNKIPMNLSITGKKFTTPNPKMPVSLVISQKPVSTTPAQPKPNPIKQLLPYQAKNKPSQPKSFSVQNKTSAKPG